MKNFLASIPLPISALMLSFATLGNSLKEFPYTRMICGIVSSTICILLILKIFICKDSVKQDMKNPVIASVFTTFSMGLIVLSTYVQNLASQAGFILWIIGICVQIGIVFYVFTMILQTKKILPSHYVTFVGIVVASVTAPMFGQQFIGFIIFIVGFVAFLVLTPLIFKNLFRKEFLPRSAYPTRVIVAAPLSLCLAGYLNSTNKINVNFALFLFWCAFFLTLLGIYFLAQSIQNQFNPAYASYTFPIVISSVASKGMALQINQKAIYVIAQVETFLAIIIVICIFISYILYIREQNKTKKSKL